MNRVDRHLRTLATLVVLAALAGACGGAKAKTVAVTTTTRSTVSTTTVPPTPASPASVDAATATVKAFMDSRVGAAGAEGYLTDDAKAVYVAQIKLYDVVSYTVGTVDGSDQNAIKIPVTIVAHSGSARTELLGVGPGATNTVPRLSFIIRSASAG
jgi:hypothetical protein